MNKDATIDTLNNLLQGTYIAIDSYSRYIGKVDDQQLRHRLENQQLTHKLIAQELNSHIRDIGGEPKSGPGLKGVTAEISNTVQLAAGDKPNEILDMIYKGAEMGIHSMELALTNLNDDKSKVLVNRHLEKERDILNKVQDLKLTLH